MDPSGTHCYSVGDSDNREKRKEGQDGRPEGRNRMYGLPELRLCRIDAPTGMDARNYRWTDSPMDGLNDGLEHTDWVGKRREKRGTKAL